MKTNSLNDSLRDACLKYSANNAVSEGDNTITYNDLWMEIEKLKCLFNQVENLKIALLMQNEMAFIIYYLAIICSENICVPLPYYSKSDEIKHSVENMDIDVIITTKTNLILNTNVIHISEIDRLIDLKRCQDQVENTCVGVKLLLQTSGSVGSPKVVMLSELNILSSATSHANALNISSEDRFLITMSMHFSSVLSTQILSYLLRGSQLLIRNIPILPRVILNEINQGHVNSFSAVPSLLRQLVGSLNRIERNLDYICVSGASLDKNLANLICDKLHPERLIQTYGMTEASPRISLGEYQCNHDIPSCGKVVEGVKIKIRDMNGIIITEPGIVGEVYVSGPNIMTGYYKNQVETERILKEGWLRTGDLAFLNEMEEICIVGRVKNIINTGGQIIYPEEVENCLRKHPLINECVVCSQQDSILEEVPIAIIKSPVEIDQNTLRNFCVERMSNYKIPRKFYFVEDFPLTKTGKIDRGALLRDFQIVGLIK